MSDASGNAPLPPRMVLHPSEPSSYRTLSVSPPGSPPRTDYPLPLRTTGTDPYFNDDREDADIRPELHLNMAQNAPPAYETSAPEFHNSSDRIAAQRPIDAQLASSSVLVEDSFCFDEGGAEDNG